MNLMSSMNSYQQSRSQMSFQNFADKSIQILLQKKQSHNCRPAFQNKQLFQSHENQVITVPIKQYSNKFLREKKKQDIQGNTKKKQPFLNSHLQNNRKLISEFKKYKGRSQKFKKSLNKENGEFIIPHLLFQKNNHLLPANPNVTYHKTIFGSFTQNFSAQTNHHQLNNEQSCLFDKGWKTVKNQNPFQTKKQVYEKICQKQKLLIPEYRKKCKTFTDVSNFENPEDREKKVEKISTSRALQKYSKIIKVNPQHGKIQRMKIKKELAKSLRFQNIQKSEFQTKQITLSKKQVMVKNKSQFISYGKQLPKRHYSIDHTNKQNENSTDIIKLPERLKARSSKEDLRSVKMGLFQSGIKFKKLRKFSHQVQSYKKCSTEEKPTNIYGQKFEDFEINGWDINF